MTQQEHKSSNELASQRTDLAVDRSVMAANRTLMAWVRTALSTISFGFTIYKVLLSVESDKPGILHAQSPKRIGLFLISLGTIAIILGTVEYYQTMRHLDKMTVRYYRPLNFTTMIGVAVGLLGIFLIITMLLNEEIF